MLSVHSAIKEKESQLESSIDSWQSAHQAEAEKVKKDLEAGELRPS
jgi:gas vesicle protein